MKKTVIILGTLGFLLAGCTGQQAYETLGQIDITQPAAEEMQVLLTLPDNVAVPIMQDEENGTMYMCDGYVLCLQTMDGGDLSRTLKEHTGYGKEELSNIQTVIDGIHRCDGVWTTVGESGEQIGRIAVLDDGNYHYVLTAMADAELGGQLQDVWEEIFTSMRLADPDTVINIGS